MSAIRDAANNAFRDFRTAGLPASGPHEVQKGDVRALFGTVEDTILAVQLAAAVNVKYAEKALMDADSSQPNGTLALVYADSVLDNNGYWFRQTGAWQRSPMLSLGDGIAAAIDAAIGDAEAAISVAEATAVATITNTGGLSSFDTAANGVAAAASGQLFGLDQAFGRGVDLMRDTAGVAKFQALTAGARGDSIRALRQAQLSALHCTQMPAGWDVWFALDAELTDRRYIPYRNAPPAVGGTRVLANVFGAGEIRTDGSTGNPVLTRFAADGPLGAATACLAVFGSNSHVLEVVGADTVDLVAGKSYTIEITAVVQSGGGAKTYRLGQTTGTSGVDYLAATIPDEAGVTFTDPTNAAITFTHTFTADASKKVGFFPATSGDAATLKIGSVRLIPADSNFMPLASQVWGGYACRGTASGGAITLDSDFCFTMVGITDGLIDFHTGFPTPVDYSTGKTEVVLGEFIGGAASGSYAVMCAEDFDPGLTPSTAYTTFGIVFDNSTQEGQYAPQPSYNLSRHGANGIGMGLQAWWNRYGPTSHDYGVDGAVLYERTPTFASWSARAERMGSYNGTRDITHASFRNNMRIAAKARKRGVATDEELVRVVKALKEQYLMTSRPLGLSADWLGMIGDSNDTRGLGEYTYLLTAAGYMGAGKPNVMLRNEAIGGKGLYSGTVAAFSVNTVDGFKVMLDRLRRAIDIALAADMPAAVVIRGFTNDYQQAALDSARVLADYATYLWDPIRATGADLLLMAPLASSDRFPGDTVRQSLINGQAAYANSHSRVWFRNPLDGAWVLANEGAMLQSDKVHLTTAVGDPDVADEYRTLIQAWRDQR